MGTEKKQDELHAHHRNNVEKIVESNESWGYYYDFVSGLEDKVHAKIYKKVGGYINEEVFPSHKNIGVNEKDQMIRFITRILVEKNIAPITESLNDADKQFRIFMQKYSDSKLQSERLIKKIGNPISDYEITCACDKYMESVDKNE